MERVCIVPGCNRTGQHMGNYRKDGSIIRRKHCSKHHGIKYGLNGWDYKQHRKLYCENIDGRLGFKCTTTIVDTDYQLEVDHIDENHNNSVRENLQTLCACCHRIKTKYTNENNQKALKIMKEYVDETN